MGCPARRMSLSNSGVRNNVHEVYDGARIAARAGVPLTWITNNRTKAGMYDVRPLCAADLDLVCGHRERMFREASFSEEVLAAMAGPFRQWLRPRLEDGRYLGWIAEADKVPVGGIGFVIIDWPPHPSHPALDRRGYILNLFLEPMHRRAGLAKRIMALATAEIKRQGITFMVLHATELGRPVHERLGWSPTTEMAISMA